jgi:hypothetical protein
MSSIGELLRSYTEGFKTSKPIFRVHLGSSGRFFDAELKEVYVPEFNSTDPVESMLKSHYSETFDKHKEIFVVNMQNMISRTINSIEDAILEFLEKHQGIKKPKQSSLYLFVSHTLLNRNYHNTESANLILELYRYLILNDEHIRDIENSVHKQNVLSILNLMRDTHEAR